MTGCRCSARPRRSRASGRRRRSGSRRGPGAGKTVAELIVARRVGDRRVRVEHRARVPAARRPGRHIVARASRGLQQDVRNRPPRRAVGVRSQRPAVAVPRAREANSKPCSTKVPAGSARSGTSPTPAARGVRRSHQAPRGRVGLPLVVTDHQRRAPRHARPRGDDRPDARSRSSTSPARRALDVVQRVAMRQMDVAIGRVVYTPLLTPSGGFKQDLTIMRLADDMFRVVTGGAYGMSDLKWFADHLPDDGSAQIHDQTNAWTHARPVGPASPRHPVERHLSDDVSHEGSRSPAAADRGRPAAGARLPDLLRRRSRLGAVRPDRAGRAAVGHRSPRPARRTGSSPPASACTAPRAAWRSATAPTAPSSRATSTSSRPAWPGARSRTQDFIGKEAHVRHREEEPGRAHVHADRRGPHLDVAGSSATCSATSRS